MVDGLTRVESEIADLMQRIKEAEIVALDCRTAVAPLLSRQLELDKGICVGRVFRFNGLGSPRPKNAPEERAVLESITWKIPGQITMPMPPVASYKLRRINADGKLSRIVHDVNGLWQWDFTPDVIDFRSAERA